MLCRTALSQLTALHQNSLKHNIVLAMSVDTSIEGFTPEVPGWQRCRVLLRRCLHSTAEIWATSDICASSIILNLSRWHIILNLTRWQVLSIIYTYRANE